MENNNQNNHNHQNMSRRNTTSISANGYLTPHQRSLSYVYTHAPRDHEVSNGVSFITDYGVYENSGSSNGVLQLTDFNSLEQKKKKRKNRYRGTPWITILTDFASICTIHGVNHIAAPQPFLLRRFLWLLLFLGGSALLGLQIYNNVVYFLSWPMTVDVKINYNDTVTFPAVTICNQNAFRASEAFRLGIYDRVSHIFTEASSMLEHDHGHNGTETATGEIDSEIWNAMPLDELYRLTGHRPQDLIVNCEWHGSPCTYDEFSPVLTDFGLCYMFNGPEGTPLKVASQTGSEGGLRLHLNIEQYDYMSGPNPGAGLKLQVHNPEEPPLVNDHGIAVPPGSHAFISVKTVEVNNLKKPHGKCNDSVELEYYDEYKMSTCKTNCKQAYLMNQCQCRDIYMADESQNHRPEDLPVCLLGQYLDCMLPALETFGALKDKCECPVPCYRLLYEETVSYSAASNFDIQGLLHDEEAVVQLQRKYRNAREVEQRVNRYIVHQDRHVIDNLNQSACSLHEILANIVTTIQAHLDRSNDMYSEFQQRLTFHENRGLLFVKYTMQHDFIRAWEVFRERAYNFVTQDYFDVPGQIQRALQESHINFTDNIETGRKLITLPLRNIINGRLACIERAKEYLNQTRQDFYTGDPWLQFRLTRNRHYDPSYITLDLIQSGIADEQGSYDSLQVAFEWMTEGADKLLQICDEFEQFGTFNESLFEQGDKKFQAGARRYNYRIFIYESRVVNTPLEVINSVIEHFERLNRTLSDSNNELIRFATNIQQKINNFLEQYFSLIYVLSLNASEYLMNLNRTKTDLGVQATSHDMTEVYGVVAIFFPELRAILQDLREYINTVKYDYHDMWVHLLTEPSTLRFYQHVHNDTTKFRASRNSTEDAYLYEIFSYMLDTPESVLQNYSREYIEQLMNGDLVAMDLNDVIMGVSMVFNEMANSIDASTILGNADEHLLVDLQTLRDLLEEFKDRNEIDASFYRDNFMRVDVYMQELSYEVVTQQESYDSAKLLSDIGGSMGLFIGGSVLSLFELADVFIHNIMRRMLQK